MAGFSTAGAAARRHRVRVSASARWLVLVVAPRARELSESPRTHAHSVLKDTQGCILARLTLRESRARCCHAIGSLVAWSRFLSPARRLRADLHCRHSRGSEEPVDVSLWTRVSHVQLA